MDKFVSIIIPAYNEQNVIADCLASLSLQNYKYMEIILVDDGSGDKTVDIAQTFKVKILKQKHKGPGSARNLGAACAKGEILVFVDADMTFDNKFIKDLTSPILSGKTIGSFSKNEMNANSKNVWSLCWNINRNWPKDRQIPQDYPDEAPVFRAILKKEFQKVGGFDISGEYTDDWSLSRKLGVKSTLAEGAVYYHKNPASLGDVWAQARWIGKNEFISGTISRRVKSLILYSFPMSILIALYKAVVKGQLFFVVFKIVYDLAITLSVASSFFGEQKAK